jgi:hypothetical protein
MNDLRTAAQQALEALEWHYRQGHSNTLGGLRLKIDEKALRNLGAALAQQAEPVEPVEPVPAAVVATQSDVWRGYNGQWQAPGEPIKMVRVLLRDLPTGTLLYTAPPQRKPLVDPAEYDDAGAAEHYNRGLK